MLASFSNSTNGSNALDLEDDLYFIIYYYGFFLSLSFINIPGNILVIVTILKHRRLRIPNNYFLVSLAVSDLLIGFVYPIYNISHLEVSWIKGPLGE